MYTIEQKVSNLIDEDQAWHDLRKCEFYLKINGYHYHIKKYDEKFEAVFRDKYKVDIDFVANEKTLQEAKEQVKKHLCRLIVTKISFLLIPNLEHKNRPRFDNVVEASHFASEKAKQVGEDIFKREYGIPDSMRDWISEVARNWVRADF